MRPSQSNKKVDVKDQIADFSSSSSFHMVKFHVETAIGDVVIVAVMIVIALATSRIYKRYFKRSIIVVPTFLSNLPFLVFSTLVECSRPLLQQH